EYNTVKMHAMHGYNYLRPKDIDVRVKLSAMMHHERCDGSGYPMNLHSDQIDDFAKIVAIADVYDAMTSARVYRGPVCPLE
ncbi:HD domain-containing phosphohydrolase, partial [Acinetobacter baumannii]|nr:HD domain-containing phosphohydrolase [Acinetobacter baumannii]